MTKDMPMTAMPMEATVSAMPMTSSGVGIVAYDVPEAVAPRGADDTTIVEMAPMIAVDPAPAPTIATSSTTKTASTEPAKTDPVSTTTNSRQSIMPPCPAPVYYVPDWIKAIAVISAMAAVFAFEFHTSHCMFSWFSQTPMK